MPDFSESMIDHLNIGVSDIERSRPFYEQALQPLGYRLLHSIPPQEAEADGEQAKAKGTLYGFGRQHKPLFWILGNVRVGEGIHIGFTARTRAEVDAFYAAALEAGGTDNGKPGLRRYHPDYYGGFILDPDGINIEAVCHAPQ